MNRTIEADAERSFGTVPYLLFDILIQTEK